MGLKVFSVLFFFLWLATHDTNRMSADPNSNKIMFTTEVLFFSNGSTLVCTEVGTIITLCGFSKEKSLWEI